MDMRGLELELKSRNMDGLGRELERGGRELERDGRVLPALTKDRRIEGEKDRRSEGGRIEGEKEGRTGTKIILHSSRRTIVQGAACAVTMSTRRSQSPIVI